MLNRLKEIFGSFQNHDVKYLVIGGIAAVLYGVPRATFDLDILAGRAHAFEAGKSMKIQGWTECPRAYEP